MMGKIAMTLAIAGLAVMGLFSVLGLLTLSYQAVQPIIMGIVLFGGGTFVVGCIIGVVCIIKAIWEDKF